MASAPSTTLIRASLWLTFPFNLAAAALVVFPDSAPGRLLGLPDAGDPLLTALTAYFIATFGFLYAWLARREQIDRPMLALGAIGKAGVFVIAAALWAAGAAAGGVVAVASGDLMFASLWVWWLLAGRAGN